MRRLLAAAPLLALCLAVPAAGAAPGTPKKTLEECIELALAQQPRLRAAGASVDAARERVWQSAAAYLPQVTASYAANRRSATTGSLTGGGSFAGGEQRSRTFNFFSTGVALSQVLFDFGQNLALIHRAQALESSIAADAETERDAVVFGVSQAYFGLLAAYRLRDVADEVVRQDHQHLALAQGRFDVGFAPKFDVTQAQVQLASAELNQVTARNNVTSGARRSGTRSVCRARSISTSSTCSTRRAWRSTRPTRRARVRQSPGDPEHPRRASAAALQVDAIRKDYLPKVSGGANYMFRPALPAAGHVEHRRRGELSVFNGGLTTAQVGEARATWRSCRRTRPRSARTSSSRCVRPC